jgi:DNA polymerase IV (DinB-like DNA polymerase)
MTTAPCYQNPAECSYQQAGPVDTPIIMHIDMDSFYASAEMQRRPEIRNMPVVIGADPKGGRGRGVACTCSYEARRFGIRSAMPVSQAYVLCPHAIFLPPDFGYYALVSQQIMALLKSFGFRIQQVSIDEAFLDLSPCGSFESARNKALEVQERIRENFGLTCSAGIAAGRTIAKIASDYRKPAGLTVVEPAAAAAFLSPLHVKKIPGIGRKTEAELLELGIRTIGDLAACDIQVLLARFGRGAVTLHDLAQGSDHTELEEHDGVKSISRETTFLSDTDDPDLLAARLLGLAGAVHEHLSAERLRFRIVTVKIRYHGYITRTRSRTLPHYTNEPGPVRACSQEIFRELYDGRKVRLIGIRLSSFEKPDRCQQTLAV